ncbi:hypothetical protein Q6A73_06420 [Aliarcobacter skirrowii]|uniref:hypothetical protein n=1 Tax=Aliarcobacter skirrowii TaxID=28200 RepID=UPI0029ADD156|nr:hypothetical protein [Aliarcobacter skirrowii]MDX4026239.1 hypothetical protein [Aliarcobacter skirrowii]
MEKLCLLEEMKTGKYIRPINLIRADENRGEKSLTYDKIKSILIEDFKIDENQIAVQTGDKKELDGVDLFSRDCPIRYIITVDALKEGWDCSFAYVLSVVSNMQSATAIEQLIGRVLRMPYIEAKDKKELERSYVYVASSSFEDVAQNIGKTLINSGFEEMEAKISIDRSQNTNEDLSGLFGDSLYIERQFVVENLDIEALTNSKLEPYINVNIETNTVTIRNIPIKSKREEFFKNIKKATPIEVHQKIDEIEKSINQAKNEFSEKISDIEIPKLQIMIDDEIYDFEDSLILDFVDIDESELIKNSKLSFDEFDIKLNENLGLIDVNQSGVTTKILDKEEDKLPLFNDEDKDEKNILNQNKILQNSQEIGKLSNSIAKLIAEENKAVFYYFDSSELKGFISLIINDLINSRKNIDLVLLNSRKYQLKKAILKKLENLTQNAKSHSFAKLFNENRFSLNMSNSVCFSSNNYIPNPDIRSANFKKHKYDNVHKLDSEEEYKVALYIDSLDGVESWIRNIDKDYENSFWLQTEEGKFYPDFIIKLKSGKIVVAEYKGKVYIPEYEKYKKPVADAWGSLDENFKFVSLYKDNFETILQTL